MNLIKYFTIAALSLGFGILQVFSASESTVMTKFEIPVQFDEEGNVKVRLLGEKAEMMPNKPVLIHQLKLFFYNKTKESWTVTSPQCEFDRTKNVITSDADIQIGLKKGVITGKGYIYNAKEEKLSIFKNVKIVLENLMSKATTNKTK